MNQHGFVKVAVCSPEVAIANPTQNERRIDSMLQQHQDSDIVVFPELSLTGYTCGDLFKHECLLNAATASLVKLSKKVGNQLIFVGTPLCVEGQLFNCAAVINNKKIVGFVPKAHIPTYNEFYEKRWFTAAHKEMPHEVYVNGNMVPFGTDLLFTSAQDENLIVGVEICESLWVPIPPSSMLSLAGATIIANLSASNETTGKSEYRLNLICNQSARCLAAYAYASAGPSESTSDLVFGGHCVIAENGDLLTQSDRVGGGKTYSRNAVTADIDVHYLVHERRSQTSFGDQRSLGGQCRKIVWHCNNTDNYCRKISGLSFVPKENLETRCAEIFDIQCHGLAKRLSKIPNWIRPVIGISGGLDSTLAALVACKTFDNLLCRSREDIIGVSMRGYGTSDETYNNSRALIKAFGFTEKLIDIREGCLQDFKSMEHKPFIIDCSKMTVDELQAAILKVPLADRHDLVFENVQARKRTFFLMNMGFVIGTGDLSELALGWCTYNGDHMSMYNVNCSIPKTLVKWLVKHVSEHKADDNLREVLQAVLATKISPELLPTGNKGEIVQDTEGLLGPYELHDFFLFHFIRNGFSPTKILFLAEHADFSKPYSPEVIKDTLKIFITRFFQNQFKRNCVPDGPKVGSVALSPRGDWRCPSDADLSLWMLEAGYGEP